MFSVGEACAKHLKRYVLKNIWKDMCWEKIGVRIPYRTFRIMKFKNGTRENTGKCFPENLKIMQRSKYLGLCWI